MSQNIIDKLINHVIADKILLPTLDNSLIDMNVATRIGKGTHYGIRYLKKYLNELKGETIYALKFDISKYFYSIDHDILFDLLKKKIKDKDALDILFKIIESTDSEYVNKKIPKAKILILTNGFYLTQVILDELSKYHLWCIAVSSYSLKEHERLSGLKTHVPYYVFFSVLDDRKSIYERGVLNCTLPCFNPLNDFNILSTGEVGLCCLDYENRFTFGSLGEGRTIASVLSSEAYTTVCNELREGKRRLLICKNCDWAR